MHQTLHPEPDIRRLGLGEPEPQHQRFRAGAAEARDGSPVYDK